MLRTSLEPPIVKSGGKVKNPADEIILTKSALVFYNPKNFGSSDGVFDLDTCAGYFCFSRFLLPGKFFSFGLLCGLYNSNFIEVVPMISSILLKEAFVMEGIHFIGNTLVVHLSLHSEAGKEDKSCHTGDSAFLTMCFFFLPL